MRTPREPHAESSRNALMRWQLGVNARSFFATLLVCAPLLVTPLLAGAILHAQPSPAPASASVPTHKHAHTRKSSKAAQPAAQPAPAPVPVAPKPPDWPVNDLPAAASVVWDSHGLLIVASNSSLAQILKEVSTVTGTKIEGMGQDERVFGTYGPGSAHDVLSKLLDGSGYNVLMIGDQGQGTPRRIVLSGHSGGGAQPSAKPSPSTPSDEDTDADQQTQQSEQPQPAPFSGGPAPPVPVRPQEQIFQEMQQRQQQQQQQQNPQN